MRGCHMNKWKKLSKLFTDPSYRFQFLASNGLYNWLPDEEYLCRKYYAKLHKELNLHNPQSFSEKIQWLKIHDRNPIYSTMVDKYEVKEYVASIIGKQYVIPTFGMWEHFNDIDFESLPNSFVLKCTHDSGGNVIVTDKNQMDRKDARKRINSSLKKNYFLQGREWPYKTVKPRIIAEQLLVDENIKNNAIINNAGGLLDYKFYCFNGEPRFLYVGFANIQNGEKHDLLSFFDFEWQPTPFYRKDHDPIPFALEKPGNLNEMIEIATKLSKDIPFVRVDLYNIEGKILFSEMTFAPGSGFGPFYPEEWERKLGDWILLPDKTI